jgi:hypothetical protein
MSAEIKTLRKLHPADIDLVATEELSRERVISSRRIHRTPRHEVGRCIYQKDGRCTVEANEEYICPCPDFISSRG